MSPFFAEADGKNCKTGNEESDVANRVFLFLFKAFPKKLCQISSANKLGVVTYFLRKLLFN